MKAWIASIGFDLLMAVGLRFARRALSRDQARLKRARTKTWLLLKRARAAETRPDLDDQLYDGLWYYMGFDEPCQETSSPS